VRPVCGDSSDRRCRCMQRITTTGRILRLVVFVLYSMPSMCCPSLRVPNRKRETKSGFRCALPSRSLHGVPATPGNGRGARASSFGLTSRTGARCGERRKKLAGDGRGQRPAAKAGKGMSTRRVSALLGQQLLVGFSPDREAERAKLCNEPCAHQAISLFLSGLVSAPDTRLLL
jgi:hypothetical protein